MEKIRLTASDRESLIRLNVAFEILETEGKQLERRLQAIQGGKRDYGLLKSKINKLMENMTDTIPDDQLMTYVRSLQMASYTVGIKRPVTGGNRDKDYGIWWGATIIV